MEDDCFDKSPFSSAPMINVQFKGGGHLNVQQAVLQQHPKLALLVSSSPCQHCGTSSQSLSLKNISRSAGHTLIHYLYTDTYHALGWLGPTTGRKETIAKLKTGFEVYTTARNYELDGLEALAKEQISLHSKDLDAFTIVDAVNEIYPASSDKDTWFPTYIKAIVKTAFRDPTALVKPEVRDQSENELGGSVSTAKTLLRGALEAYREMVEPLALKDASVKPEKPTPAIDSSQMENGERKRRETTEETEKDKANILAALEELELDEPVKPAKPDLNPVNRVWGIKNGKVGKNCAATEVLKAKEQPAEPKPTPKPEGEGDATTGSTTSGSLFNGLSSGSSTVRAAFGATNNAATDVPPDAASLSFTPRTEETYPGHIDCFPNIFLTDACKQWSNEELRLADYNQGRKPGSAGGTGASGAFSAGNTGFGTRTQANTGFGATKVASLFGTSQPAATDGLNAVTTTNFEGFGGSRYGLTPATTTNTGGFGFGSGGFGAKPITTTHTGGFGFGSGGSGAKPAAATTASTGGFGGFGSGGFGAKLTTTTHTGGFGFGSGSSGVKPATTTTTNTGGFGFSSNGLGIKPAAAATASTGGFGGSDSGGFSVKPTTTINTSLFGGSGSGAFSAKPTTTTTTNTGGFGGFGSGGFSVKSVATNNSFGSTHSQPAQPSSFGSGFSGFGSAPG